MMEPKILCGIKEDYHVPRGSVGRILLDALNSYDPQARAVLNLETGETTTFGDLVEQSLNLASYLRQIGVGPNDFMAMVSENSVKVHVVFLAGLYLGTPVHFLNPSYTSYEMENILNISKPKVMFYTSKSSKALQNVREKLEFVDQMISLNNEEHSQDSTTHLYSNLIRTRRSNFSIFEDFDADTKTAVVFNSSGTTGLPKGVELTHSGLRHSLIESRWTEAFATQPGENLLMPLPLFHIYGFSFLLFALYKSLHLVVMNNFDSEVFLKAIQDHKIRKLFLVPTLVNFVAHNPQVDEYDLSSVLVVYSGGAPVDADTATKVAQRLKNAAFYNLYGLTETCGAAMRTRVNHSKDGSCGKPYPNVQVAVKDLETGAILGPDLKGEICIRGKCMKGYLNEEAKTREIFDSEGFLHSGDIGYYDSEGFVFIVDRLKDMIKYKSFQVSPVEVEEVLSKHPGVATAGVVGQPDHRCGELPVAFVVKKPGWAMVTEKELIEFVEVHLSREKCLHGGVKFVQEIPRNSVGKILRQDLRKML